MKRPILAATLALSTLSGCATVLNSQNCERALSGLTAAQEIVSVLQSHGVKPELAAKVASALSLGQIGVGVACSVAGSPGSI